VPAEDGPLPGARDLPSETRLQALVDRLAAELDDPEAAAELVQSYGSRAPELLELVAADAALGQRIAEDLPYIWAQVPYSARHELALTLSDVLIRRTQVFYRDLDQGLTAAPRAAELMAAELGWDADETRRQLGAYNRQVALNRRWLARGRLTERRRESRDSADGLTPPGPPAEPA
jgi:glycerol-3-phosphate dehydrogenase